MSGRRCALVIAAGLACLVAAPAADAKYGFDVSPRVGKPRTVFKVSFVAPFAASDGDATYYLEGIGPPLCPSLFEFSERVQQGKRVVMRLTPGDDITRYVGVPRRSRWCRGGYVGVVHFDSGGFDEDDVFIGRFRFRVGSPRR